MKRPVERLEEEFPDQLRVLESSKEGRWFLENGHLVVVTYHRQARFGVGQCHENASWLSRRSPEQYTWWTGYAIKTPYGAPIDNHSWVRDSTGRHVEVTY